MDHGWLRTGFMMILLKVLQLCKGGLLIGGPPCGSFVWVNRSTSRRSKTRLLGDSSRAYVKGANSILFSGECVYEILINYNVWHHNRIMYWILLWLNYKRNTIGEIMTYIIASYKMSVILYALYTSYIDIYIYIIYIMHMFYFLDVIPSIMVVEPVVWISYATSS